MPDTEHNFGSVYVRFNIQPYEETTDEQTYKGWVYDEWFMTEYEYQMVQQGQMPYGGAWDDALRSVERASLYRTADDMIAKYSTDVPDESKKQLWIQYKHAVRDTQTSPSYPTEVTYPMRPE